MASFVFTTIIVAYPIIMVFVPLIVKIVDKNKHLPKGVVSFRPLSYALFVFLMDFFGVLVFPCFVYDWLVHDHIISFVFGLIFGLLSGACSCWVGSLLNAKILISPKRLVLTHAALLDKGRVHFWNLGSCNLDLSWDDIAILECDLNFLRIELWDNTEYIFPIGWCPMQALTSLKRYKQVGIWDRPKSFFM